MPLLKEQLLRTHSSAQLEAISWGMDNVIRPTFRRAEADAAPDTVEAFSPLNVYDAAVGHFIALIRAEDEKAGMTLQVIVGRDGGEGAEPVAVFLDSA